MQLNNNLDDILTQDFSSFLPDLPSDWHANQRELNFEKVTTATLEQVYFDLLLKEIPLQTHS